MMTSWCNISEGCVVIFTDTWLNSETPDEAAELADCELHRANRTPEAGTKTGGGLCTSQ